MYSREKYVHYVFQTLITDSFIIYTDTNLSEKKIINIYKRRHLTYT